MRSLKIPIKQTSPCETLYVQIPEGSCVCIDSQSRINKYQTWTQRLRHQWLIERRSSAKALSRSRSVSSWLLLLQVRTVRYSVGLRCSCCEYLFVSERNDVIATKYCFEQLSLAWLSSRLLSVLGDDCFKRKVVQRCISNVIKYIIVTLGLLQIFSESASEQNWKPAQELQWSHILKWYFFGLL